MPHLTIEYSANIEDALDVPALVDSLHAATTAIDAFPLAGMRTRAVRRDHYRIADGHPDNGYVHCVLRIGHGRPLELRKAAGEEIFAAICDCLAPLYDSTPLAISFEMQEIDPDLNFKKNNLRDYLAERAA